MMIWWEATLCGIGLCTVLVAAVVVFLIGWYLLTRQIGRYADVEAAGQRADKFAEACFSQNRRISSLGISFQGRVGVVAVRRDLKRGLYWTKDKLGDVAAPLTEDEAKRHGYWLPLEKKEGE